MSAQPEYDSSAVNPDELKGAIEHLDGASFAILSALKKHTGRTLFEEGAEISNLSRRLSEAEIKDGFREKKKPIAGSISELTKRELEIIELLALGLDNRTLASRLWVTEQTIKFHLSNIYRKLDVSNRTEASRVYLDSTGNAPRLEDSDVPGTYTIPEVDMLGQSIEDPEIRDLRLAAAFMERSRHLIENVIGDRPDAGN